MNFMKHFDQHINFMKQFEEKLDNGEISVTNPQDFVNMAKIDQTLQGQPSGDETTINIITAIPRPSGNQNQDQITINATEIKELSE